jgi:hypothetical protein
MTDHTRMSETDAAVEARRLITEAYQPEQETPTSYRDDTPLPKIGSTPPVPQPDHRVVPTWATGAAVGSIGAGTGVLGVCIGIRLVLDGAAAMTMTGVVAISAPFVGAAVVIVAAGAAISRAKQADTHTEVTNVYEGPVTQHTEVNATSENHGWFGRTTTNIPRD